jgi:drug/metabolite transporter (DMT)-like permease
MSPMPALAAALALLAAALFAVGAAVQQRAAATVPDDRARGLGLLVALARRPSWWAGTSADVAGYVAQAAALGLGSLLLVQPLLVTSLLFALPLGARWAGRRLTRADWTWSVLLALALALFVATGEPTAGVDRAGAGAWAPVALVLGVLLGACLAGAALRPGTTRALLLAVATGVLYGVAAALTKGVVTLLAEGPWTVLTSGETYGLAVALAAGTLLQQAAFRAGDLAASLPAVTVGEPVVGVLIGVAVLHEQLRAGGAERALVGGLVAVMVVATVALARSAARTQPASVS